MKCWCFTTLERLGFIYHMVYMCSTCCVAWSCLNWTTMIVCLCLVIVCTSQYLDLQAYRSIDTWWVVLQLYVAMWVRSKASCTWSRQITRRIASYNGLIAFRFKKTKKWIMCLETSSLQLSPSFALWYWHVMATGLLYTV